MDAQAAWEVVTLDGAEFRHLLALPLGTYRKQMADGLLVPAYPGVGGRPGNGHHGHRFSMLQTLALAAARGLGMAGVCDGDRWRVYESLSRMPAAEMKRAFVEGRMFLAIVGTRVLPRLVSQAAIFTAATEAGVDVRTAAEAGVPVTALNVMALLEKITERLRQMRESR